MKTDARKAMLRSLRNNGSSDQRGYEANCAYLHTKVHKEAQRPVSAETAMIRRLKEAKHGQRAGSCKSTH